MKTDARKAYERHYKREYAKRHRQISVTVTNAEYKALEKQAKQEKTKVATLVKQMALVYQQQQVLIPDAVQEDIKTLKFLIRNIANNVNQMAHHSNTVHALVEENAFLQEIQKLEQTVEDYTLKRLKPLGPEYP